MILICAYIYCVKGNVVQKPGLTFGACDKEPKFKGQLDDVSKENIVRLNNTFVFFYGTQYERF